jgi:hypothetical protein
MVLYLSREDSDFTCSELEAGLRSGLCGSIWEKVIFLGQRPSMLHFLRGRRFFVCNRSVKSLVIPAALGNNENLQLPTFLKTIEIMRIPFFASGRCEF